MDSSLQMVFGFVFGALVLSSVFMLFVWGFRRWRKPQIEFLDLVYDKTARQLELFVVNEGEKPVYVNPSLRLVHFLDPEEWREKKSNGGYSSENMVAGKCYQVDSVIKGYTLVGECPESVRIDGRGIRKIIYPLSEDVNLRVYDNIRVDSQYGFDGVSDERLVNTMRVVLKDDVDTSVFGNILPEIVKPVYNPNFCLTSSSQENRSVVVETVLPIQAMCVCCGKDKWLEWIVDGNHVCAGCKDFLGGKTNGALVLPEPSLKESTLKTDRYGDVCLKPRQREILNLLEHENNLNVKKISKLLSIKESTVASDLKSLMEKDLVGRIEIGKRYLYHLA